MAEENGRTVGGGETENVARKRNRGRAKKEYKREEGERRKKKGRESKAE